MNTDKLLDIINCILTEKNIYELFKNHGYGESFENLQTDLANLLDKFIVTDNELSEVAGGRANALTRVSSGILASIASFSGMNFVGAQTLKEEQSKSQRVFNNIKETGVNSAKKAAKFVINNGGKIAGGGTLLVTWSLLCALIGRHTKKVPVVETKDMTEDEKKLIRFAQEVLTKIYNDIKSGSKEYFNSEHDNYQNLKELIKGSEQIEGIPAISGEVRVGDLVANLLPEPKENSTQAYRDGRDDLIKNENDNIDLAKNLIKQHSNETEHELREKLTKLATEHGQQKNRLEQIEQEKKDLQEKMDNAANTHKEELEKIEKEKERLQTQLDSVSEEKNNVGKELEVLKQENTQKKKEIEEKDLKISNQEREITKLKETEKQVESTENATLTNWKACADVIPCKVDQKELKNKLHDWAGKIYDEKTKSQNQDAFLYRANVLLEFWCGSGQKAKKTCDILTNEEVRKVLTAEWNTFSWGPEPTNVTTQDLTMYAKEARRWEEFLISWNGKMTEELMSDSYLREILAFLLVSKLVGNNVVVRGIFDGIAMYVGNKRNNKVVARLRDGLAKCGLQLNPNSITNITTGAVIKFFS